MTVYELLDYCNEMMADNEDFGDYDIDGLVVRDEAGNEFDLSATESK